MFQEAVRLASGGLRIIALADGPNMDTLSFLGFVAVMDPPRDGVEYVAVLLRAKLT